MLLVVAHSLLALLWLWVVVVGGCALLLEEEDFVVKMDGLRWFLEFFLMEA